MATFIDIFCEATSQKSPEFAASRLRDHRILMTQMARITEALLLNDLGPPDKSRMEDMTLIQSYMKELMLRAIGTEKDDFELLVETALDTDDSKSEQYWRIFMQLVARECVMQMLRNWTNIAADLALEGKKQAIIRHMLK